MKIEASSIGARGWKRTGRERRPTVAAARASMRLGWKAVVCTLMTFGGGWCSGANPPCPEPAYKYLRADEDYSYLKNPQCRTDPFDGVKYIPLGDREGWFLSLGGEIRENVEYFHNARWGEGPQGPAYLLQRYIAHADFHLGTKVRFFTQVKSGLEEGRAGGPRPIDEDKFDLAQAFVEVKLGDEASPVTVRAGRQELALGSRRFVSAREGPTVRQSFDGLQVMFGAAGWKWDVLATRPVQTRVDVFDDFPSPGQALWGVYTTRALKRIQGTNLDLYYLGFDRSKSRYQQGVGAETRHSMGARVWGKENAWDFDVEPMAQVGTFAMGNVLAWTIESETGYTLREKRWTPRLGLRADGASGDRAADDSDLETLNPLFPRGLYHQLVDLNGHVNFLGLDPLAVAHFNAKVTMTVDWGFFWRQSLGDGLYGVGGQLLRPGGARLARYLGSQPSAIVEWRPQRHFSGVLIYTHFFPGPFLRDTGPAKNVNYLSGWLSFKF